MTVENEMLNHQGVENDVVEIYKIGKKIHKNDDTVVLYENSTKKRGYAGNFVVSFFDDKGCRILTQVLSKDNQKEGERKFLLLKKSLQLALTKETYRHYPDVSPKMEMPPATTPPINEEKECITIEQIRNSHKFFEWPVINIADVQNDINAPTADKRITYKKREVIQNNYFKNGCLIKTETKRNVE